LYWVVQQLLRVEDFGAAEKAIGRALSVIDRIEGLSDSEKSDYFGTLASIMKATERSFKAAEMQNRADDLFQQAKKQFEREE
jgi:hypothetical protein